MLKATNTKYKVIRFQKKISNSRWTALCTSTIAMGIWALAWLSNRQMSVAESSVGIAVAAILMGQLNNAHALIRIYSRMIMCSFLVMATVATFLFSNTTFALTALLSVVFYTFIFRCYQDKESPGWTFYAYLAVGIVSVFWIQVLFFLPILWIANGNNLMAMSLRNIIASLLGIIAPYWFLFAWYALTGDFGVFLRHFADIAEFHQPMDLASLNAHQLVALGFVLVIAITGFIHYGNTSHRDNIRTRMFYEMFITVDVTAIVFLILQPQHYAPLYGIMAVNTAPLIGHFIALTDTRWTNRYTIALIFVAAVITGFNLLMP